MTPQHQAERLSELLPRYAVEEEVDAVVEIQQLVTDGFGDFVGHVRPVRRPVGLPYEYDHRRTDADEEHEGRREAHGRRLEQLPVARLRRQAALFAHARHPDHRSNDEDVADENDAERNEVDQREYDPRPHVYLEVPVLWSGVSAVRLQRRGRHVRRYECAVDVFVDGLRFVLGSASPEHVEVLGNGCQGGAETVVLGSPGQATVRLLHREADSHEAVKGEEDSNPSGCVSARVGHELVDLAHSGVPRLEREYAHRFEPLGDHSSYDGQQIGHRHYDQVVGSGRPAHAPTAHDDEDQHVSGQADEEDDRTHVDPDGVGDLLRLVRQGLCAAAVL